MDRAALAEFLQRRREALQPVDVGLARGRRRRVAGLRREEVAMLADMSTDYYARLEQRRGPQPSTQVLTSITRALRLDLEERDHLFRLAGHPAPDRSRRTEHVAPALLRVLDRLDDTPAVVVSDLGDTLAQNRMAVALLGDQMAYSGLERSAFYRWFTGNPQERALCPPRLRKHSSAVQAAYLRTAIARGGQDLRTREMVAALLERSPEFREVWARHEVNRRHDEIKTLAHPEVGELELYCQRMTIDNQAQALLIFTAAPGSEAAEKLGLLSVIGSQPLST